MKKNIAKVIVGLPIDYSFDYLVPKNLSEKIKIGCRVWVPFSQKKLVGYVADFSPKSKFRKIRSIISLIDEEPILEQSDFKFLQDFSEYYCCALGEAIETSIPTALKDGKPVKLEKHPEIKIQKNTSFTTLIHDTSSNKRWEIFIEKVVDCLNRGGSVIFLVPEVSEITLTAKRLKEFFPKVNIAVFNRRQSGNLQTEEWQKARNGVSRIVVGTRSAVFAPLKNLKLIIIEEEDNQSYKQEQTPFYHARDVAFMRAKAVNAGLILASATPSLEAHYLAKKNKFNVLTLSEENKLPQFQVVDMTRFAFEHRRKKSVISFPLEDNIRKVLSEGARVILFMNRKGFSNVIRCKKCNFTLKCNRCNVSLTYHFDKKKLICRFCNYKIDPPQLCPQCRESYMRYSGVGTEKLESEISRIFPDKKILRFDRETGLKNDKFDILIATQIILRRADTFSAELVGVVNIDSVLNRMDFRAAEKTFALLIKLSLIAKQKIIVQTHHFNHYSVFSAAHNNFPRFYKEELKLRRSLGFPPFGHFTSIMLRGKSLDTVKNVSTSLFEKLNKINNAKDIEIFDPTGDIPDKLRGAFRWHILIKGKDVKKMNKLIKNGLKQQKKKSGIIISINVDI